MTRSCVTRRTKIEQKWWTVIGDTPRGWLTWWLNDEQLIPIQIKSTPPVSSITDNQLMLLCLRDSNFSYWEKKTSTLFLLGKRILLWIWCWTSDQWWPSLWWVVADAQVSVRLVRQVKRGHLFVCVCVCTDGASKRAETSRLKDGGYPLRI